MPEIWPNFFVVGAAKAGTTSIYAYLSQHPQVFFPAVKEPHYFAQVRPARELRYSAEAITDRGAYLRLFRHARGYKIVGDASPSYLWHPEVAYRIKRAVPDARILILLRDPIDRAFSHYLMDYREGVQDEPFYTALRRDMERTEKGWGVSYLYYELGLYSAQVYRYLDAFGPERVHLMLFEEFKRDVRRALKEMAAFLEIDPAPMARIDIKKAHNAYANVRSERMRKIAGSDFARALGKILVPRRLGKYIYEEFFLKPGRKPAIDPRAHELLRALYTDEIVAVEKVVGRTLPELRKSWYAKEQKYVADGPPRAARDDPGPAPG
jgi:hypothetical protein